MTDEDRISYLALETGVPLLTASGDRFGTVEHVLNEESLDLFDGLVVRVDAGLRFVDAGQVGDITRAAVHTTLTSEQAAHLPEPDGDAVLDADPHEFDGNALSSWFGRMFMRPHWMRERDRD